MKHLRIGFLTFFLVGLGGQSVAQTEAPAQVESVAKSEITKTTKFERAERLEAMRYRHLWIAYGLIWFIVFFFMFRTYKLGQSTASELEHLKRRLAELEGSDGTS